VNAHTASFAITVLVFRGGLLGAGTVFLRRAARTATPNLVPELLDQLQSVDRERLAAVALACADGGQDELEEWQLWEMVGGFEGLQTMAENCAILIELACHVQQWYPEALPVAEQLRLNAREIAWHIDRLKGAEHRGHLRSAFPDYAQRAVAIYYEMTQHVLDLYEKSRTPGWMELQSVL
jgi:hypothetical protein